MPFLENIEQELSSLVVSVKPDGLDYSDPQTESMVMIDLKNRISKIYEYANSSVVSGEFIEKEDLPDIIEKILSASSIENTDDCPDSVKTVLYSVLSIINKDLLLYKDTIFIFSHLRKPNYNFLNFKRKSSLKSYREGKNISDLGIYDCSELFVLNLDLLLIDVNFSLYNRSFYYVNDIEQRIKEYADYKETPYVKAMLYKCKLLKSKFIYKENSERLHISYNYYEGKEEKALDYDEAITFQDKIGKRINTINTRKESDYLKNIKFYYDNISSDESSFSYFVKCHYYKNIEKSSDRLKNLYDSFETSLKNSTLKLKYDKLNAKYCLCYLRNCLFSFNLKNKIINTLSDLKREVELLESYQSIDEIFNYFPYIKASEWIGNELKDSLILDIEKAQNSLDVMCSYIKKAEDCLYAIKYNGGCFMPYKPFFEDCLTKLEGVDFPIFISSSFIVPCDYESIDKQLRKLQIDSMKWRAIIESKISIFSKEKEINEKILVVEKSNTDLVKNSKVLESSVAEKLDESQKTVIQILSIFSAIVIFASGSIQLLSNVKNIKAAALFMLMVASILGVFVVMINVILAKNKTMNFFSLVFFVSMILVSSIGILLSWD